MEHKVIIGFRREINGNLDRPLSDGEWNLLQTDGSLEKLRRGDMDPAGVAAKVIQWRQAVGINAPPPVPIVPKLRADPASGARAELLSYLVSLIAERVDRVSAFRRDVLKDKLLPSDATGEWISKVSAKEGFSAWLEVPFSSEHGKLETDKTKGTLWVSAPPLSISKSRPATGAQWHWLRYFSGGHKEQSVRTAAGGVLERLRIASEQIAAQIGCFEAHATDFILSGSPLPVFPVRQALKLMEGNVLSALNRVELTIDPALSPSEASRVYRDIRTTIFGRRHRNMSEKHIRLALFALQRPRDEKLSVAMKEWNKLFPRWRYKAETNFGRDRTVSRRRALAALDANPTGADKLAVWEKPQQQKEGRKK